MFEEHQIKVKNTIPYCKDFSETLYASVLQEGHGHAIFPKFLATELFLYRASQWNTVWETLFCFSLANQDFSELETLWLLSYNVWRERK